MTCMARWIVLGALCVPHLAFAQAFILREIREDPRGSVVARILASFNAHADPIARWYTDALQGRRVNTREFASFARQVETATFVSATYTYTVNGEARTQVYHARSGANEPATGLPDVRPLRPYGSYFSHALTSVVAWHRSPPEGSGVTHSPNDDGRHPDARRHDAELKIARHVEADISAGGVAAGGWLNMYSSQIPCGSCERALRELSRTHDIRVHVAYLGQRTPAYRTFQRQREQFTSSIQVAANAGQLNTLSLEAHLSQCDRDCLGQDDRENDAANEIGDTRR